jgi:YbbR domain-containing protein
MGSGWMSRFVHGLKPWGLHIWAILIAIILWLQVHGQGEGSLSMDVPLQVQALPENMVIVNNLPNQVRITVKGLQARLKSLQDTDIFVPLDASNLSKPGVIERLLSPENIHLPAGLRVEAIQPDRLELQVDRIVMRTVPIHPKFDLPQDWSVVGLSIEPANVSLQGPEVWLDSINAMDTIPIRLNLHTGEFQEQVEIATPVGKSVHLEEHKGGFTVKGVLIHKDLDNTAQAKDKESH